MSYYKPCPELTRCRELDHFWEEKNYGAFFAGHLRIAQETGYALAACQVGYCYLEGLGVEKDPVQALAWTERAALKGDRDGQFNLGWIYEKGLCGPADLEQAKVWYARAARQGHDLAEEKCREMGL